MLSPNETKPVVASFQSRPVKSVGGELHSSRKAPNPMLSSVISSEDKVRCSAKLKNAMKLHVISLLKAGVSVVLDFPANTVANRKWMMGIINESCADHILHYLNVSSEICKSRLQARNQSAAPHFVVTDEQFELISQYFTEPGPEEGFHIIQYN